MGRAYQVILHLYTFLACTGVAAQSCCSMQRLSGLAGGRAACTSWMQKVGPCCPLRAPRRPWPRSCWAGLPRCPSLPPISQVHARASPSKEMHDQHSSPVCAIPQQRSTAPCSRWGCTVSSDVQTLLSLVRCCLAHASVPTLLFVSSSAQSGCLQGWWRMCWGRCWRRSSRACWACWDAAPAARWPTAPSWLPAWPRSPLLLRCSSGCDDCHCKDESVWLT